MYTSGAHVGDDFFFYQHLLKHLFTKLIKANNGWPFEIRNLRDLINAIFIDTVAHEVSKLRKEKCCGCLVDHPSQRRHDCLMMTEDEGWIEHGLEETTLNLLIDLKGGTSLSEHEPIVNYLFYWIKEH